MCKNRVHLFYFIVLFSTLLASSVSSAKPFAAPYLKFELPDDWSCRLKNAAWTCHPKKNSKHAVIVVTAKQVGKNGDYATLKSLLSRAKTTGTQSGQSFTSKVINVGERKIQGQIWFDALHSNSEINNYKTRYMLTVKGPLAVLVSLSAHQQIFDYYQKQFSSVVSTFKVSLPPALKTIPLKGADESLSLNPEDIMNMERTSLPQDPKDSKVFLLFILLGLVPILLFLWLLTRRKRKQK